MRWGKATSFTISYLGGTTFDGGIVIMRFCHLVCSLLFGVVSFGQAQIGLLTGCQYDHLRYKPKPQDPHPYDPHQSETITYDAGTGWGWHVGGSFASGQGKTAFKVCLIYSEQLVTSHYSRSQSYSGLAHSSRSETKGIVEEKFQTVEAPLLFTISMSKVLRFEVGLSPWTLVGVRACDRSVETGTSYTMTVGSDSFRRESEFCNVDLRPYTQYGVSGIFGLTGSIKERITVSGNYMVGFVPIQEFLKGHHNIFRMSIGYVIDLGQPKSGS